MKKLYTLLAFVLPLFSSAQLAVDWQRCYGGSGDENPGRIRTRDGGYIIVSTSASADGMVNNSHGNSDAWVVKMDQYGIIEWKRCYGGSGYDSGRSIFEDPSGGYIICGGTSSNDGNVSGGHSDSNGSITDIWIFKIDLTGNLIWQRCLGGSSIEDFAKFSLCTDGALLVTCQNYSDDGDVTGFHTSSSEVSSSYGNPDIWVVKLSNLGSIIWQRSLGGSGRDHGEVIEDNNGGYLVFGSTTSNDGDVVGFHEGLDSTLQWDGSWSYYRNPDGWIVKLDISGDVVWQNCLGGSDDDGFSSILQTSDGGFILVGGTASNDGDVSGYHMNGDSWVVKLSSSGDMIWQKCLGGSNWEDLKFTIVPDGYLGVGWTNSSDGDVQGFHSSSMSFGVDAWIVMLNDDGELIWQRALGGSQNDWAFQVLHVDDGYLFSGQTSSVDGDVLGYHPGMTSDGERTHDNWVFKLDYSGNLLWQNCLGGTGNEGSFFYLTDNSQQLLEITENGIILFSITYSNDGDVVGYHSGSDAEFWYNNPDIWIVNLDASGNLVSQLCLGGSGGDYLQDALNTGDGYLLFASTNSNDGDITGHYGNVDLWLVKLNDAVNVEESQVEGFSIFPNPASDKLQLNLTDHLINTPYTIYDAQGRVVLSGVLESSRSEISVADLPPAFYTLQLAGRPGALRFVKE